MPYSNLYYRKETKVDEYVNTYINKFNKLFGTSTSTFIQHAINKYIVSLGREDMKYLQNEAKQMCKYDLRFSNNKIEEVTLWD